MAMNLNTRISSYPDTCQRLRQRVQPAPVAPQAVSDGTPKLSGQLGLTLQGIRDLISHYQKPAQANPSTQPAKAAAPSAPKSGAQPAKAPQGTYTVQKGDTLSGIAKKLLGNSNRWREIYDLNQRTIGGNPNLILPGQVLQLPGAPKAQETPTPSKPTQTKPATPAKNQPAKPSSSGKLNPPDYFISQYRSTSNSKEDTPHNGNCGPTSLTMVARAFKKISVSSASADEAIEGTRRRMGASQSQYDGTSYAELVRGAKSYGLDAKVLYGKLDTIQAELNKGRLVIAHVRPNYLFPNTTSGHYTVVTKIANGKVYLNDPANSSGPIAITEQQFLAAQKGRGTYGLVSIGA